jgi:hypothetical protein
VSVSYSNRVQKANDKMDDDADLSPQTDASSTQSSSTAVYLRSLLKLLFDLRLYCLAAAANNAKTAIAKERLDECNGGSADE